ncbi:MAG: 50S ribosomal protein L16 [Chloroflexota bacterium]|jgi:large subunit ribosomal protein L16|nr:50S ribosomal protein L16 [Pseudomonadales bacterium]MEE2687154.1 50S ribosomal protein L16 [Chloroflexota bacterium]
MLQPKRTKFRKIGRGRRKGQATTGNSVSFGEYGLKAMACDWITARQIESARVAITRSLQRGGQVWIRVFPDKPVSKKPAEVRMGGGKAANDHWVAVVKPGKILFEVGGVTPQQAEAALRLAAYKLPIPTKAVQRDRLAAAVSG